MAFRKNKSKNMMLIGKKFNRLTVFRFFKIDCRGQYIFECICDCGEMTAVRLSALKNGSTKSCGCLHRELSTQLKKTHGLSGHKLNSIWRKIKNRCNCKTNDRYHRYGGRGITICKEWDESFESFYRFAVGNGWVDGLTIDRIDNDKGYEPANCRFVSKKTNSRNSSQAKRWIVKGIEYKSLNSAAESNGVCQKTIRAWCGLVMGRSKRENCYAYPKY